MVHGSSSVRVWIQHCLTNVGDMKLSVAPSVAAALEPELAESRAGS
jgi:hypothetical protein